jgi:aspartate kinase
VKKQLSIAKFGGSLLDPQGKGVSKILKNIVELKAKEGIGPIAVFSAPTGVTDELIRIGETCAQSTNSSVDFIFDIYSRLASHYTHGEFAEQAEKELSFYKKQTEQALRLIHRRFSGSVKAKVLTFGGELATASLMNLILQSNGITSSNLPLTNWPIVTDDDFDDATPNYEFSLKQIVAFTKPLEVGKAVCMAGFFGVTHDGLETILGRGGSDLSAVFTACLLHEQYDTRTLLYKDVPVQSADPKVVKGQKTEYVASLTYNEAHKASLMGMKIVQSSAIALARQFSVPLMIVPIDEPQNYSIIHANNDGNQIVKCLTGKTGCAILSLHDEKSRSLEDSLRIWEKRNDFMDLGAETLETGERIRDFLFLDSDYLRRNEEKLRGFDEKLKVEYGLGVVTLIGDRMKDSHGIASTAISAIQGLNIKRGIFAPHTSQIIIVIEEKSVKPAVAAIHQKMPELNNQF